MKKLDPDSSNSGYQPVEKTPATGIHAGKIDRLRPTRDQIVDRILDDIVSLRLKPGAAVSVKEMSTHFGVSRSPVREAVIRLTDSGFMEVYPQAGTRVAPICMDIVRQIYFVRTAIEMALVEVLARNPDTKHVAALRKILDRQRECAEANDLETFYNLDEAFHEKISELAGFPKIWDTIDGHKPHMDRLRHLVLPLPTRLKEIIDEHAAIVDKIERSDIEGARSAMSTHLQQVLKIQGILKERYPDYFE